MPYGMPRSMGGDTPALDAKMEQCVTDLVSRGYVKVSAIKICKASMEGKTKRPKRRRRGGS